MTIFEFAKDVYYKKFASSDEIEKKMKTALMKRNCLVDEGFLIATIKRVLQHTHLTPEAAERIIDFAHEKEMLVEYRMLNPKK